MTLAGADVTEARLLLSTVTSWINRGTLKQTLSEYGTKWGKMLPVAINVPSGNKQYVMTPTVYQQNKVHRVQGIKGQWHVVQVCVRSTRARALDITYVSHIRFPRTFPTYVSLRFPHTSPYVSLGATALTSYIYDCFFTYDKKKTEYAVPVPAAADRWQPPRPLRYGVGEAQHLELDHVLDGGALRGARRRLCHEQLSPVPRSWSRPRQLVAGISLLRLFGSIDSSRFSFPFSLPSKLP
jgi:hypothetical protein